MATNVTHIAPKKMAGVVVSAGRMMKTVTVRMVKQEWNRKLRKNYTVPYKLLVNDPTSAVRTGDIIHLAPERHSRHVAYTVASIVAPFGTPLEERPSLLTEEQRLAIYQEARARKAERRKERAGLVTQGILKEGDVVDDGNVTVVGIEKGQVKAIQDGREVLPGGLHKFGKTNEEATKGKRKVQARAEKDNENKKELEAV